jgi:putative aldouronate transport system permease protein
MCPIAYALSRKRFRLRRGILVFLMIPMLFSGGLVSTYMVNTQVFHLQNTYLALILPYFLSWVIVGYCLYGFLATDEGQVNHILRVLGGTAIQWYQSPGYWRVILILIEIWKSAGYAMVLYLCAITAIDRSLYEGAMLDGATFMQRVRYITIPMLRPTIATIFILKLGSLLASDFGLFYQVPLDSNSLQPVTQTLDVYVYKALMQQANFSYSAAATFLQNVVGCTLLLIANAVIRKIDEDSSLG